ncbi:hypothetical protein L2E82_13902 [Cichorium intybus]|uniref:Uncharacterized protein n=1 Tax=Cichorium intybus TaxID=13427 RepID=A0ACB9EY78_CICIN|nr:hypothetical protein L2E82_13902 [Cichorium intybus]
MKQGRIRDCGNSAINEADSEGVAGRDSRSDKFQWQVTIRSIELLIERVTEVQNDRTRDWSYTRSSSIWNCHACSQVKAQATKRGLSSNVYVGSALISMYAKCQKTGPARSVFDSLDEKKILFS